MGAHSLGDHFWVHTIRSISQCMDLILDSSFPNKGPYRIRSIENEELKREVKE